jgi:membrane-associated PAP2 superfamily phosphatase
MKARHRERWGLALTGLALVVLFEMLPLLDLWVASRFHAGQGHFPASSWLWVQTLYHVTPWIGRALFLGSAWLLLRACWRGRAPARWQWRRAAALHLVLLLGLGLVVHAVFKERWGRPRPYEVQAFAGTHTYVPALRPGGTCQRNCSFVSGHAATGFALVSLGMFSARARRRRWFGVALCSGLLIGAGRVLQGGHFISDVLFAGWLMWAVTVLTREAWLRTTLRRRMQRRRPKLDLPASTERLWHLR